MRHTKVIKIDDSAYKQISDVLKRLAIESTMSDEEAFNKLRKANFSNIIERLRERDSSVPNIIPTDIYLKGNARKRVVLEY